MQLDYTNIPAKKSTPAFGGIGQSASISSASFEFYCKKAYGNSSTITTFIGFGLPEPRRQRERCCAAVITEPTMQIVMGPPTISQAWAG